MTTCLIKFIQNERQGAEINRELIQSVVEIYQYMATERVNTYVDDFENSFLATSRDFYAKSRDNWITEDPLPVYLLKAEELMLSEVARVRTYLNISTEPKLLKVFDNEMLELKLSALIEKEGSGVKVMLINDQFDDLLRLYRLFSRPGILEPIAEIFKQHIIDCGEEKIEQRIARLEKSSVATASTQPPSNTSNEKEVSSNSSDDPQFIRDILGLHDKYFRMVQEQFNSHTCFQKALKDAFVEIVNSNVSGSKSSVKTADLLSLFCDRFLKSGSGEKLSDSEIEELLSKVVSLFAYLSEKDLFAEIYRNHLSKRLLNQRSASDDMERLMISKLKSECGAQFTAKMEGMMTDLKIGSEHALSFANHCKSHQERLGLGQIDFSVQVLTQGHWPSFKMVNILFPRQLQNCIEVFRQYYENDPQKSHRKLTWIHSLGSASVKATFKGKSYDLQVHILQAIVLNIFNEPNQESTGVQDDNGGKRSFEDLLQATGLTEDILKRVLHSLMISKFKVIKRVSNASAASGATSGGNAIKNTDIFQFNESFTCPMRKIRIPMASLEDNQSSKKVEEDRSLSIEASIVRIMKARKTLQHQQLIAEVLTQLSFFKPDPKVVKRRIEALIDREYLERDPDTPNIYRYLA